MKIMDSTAEQVCGTCGRAVGYLDFDGRVRVVDGALVEVGRAVVLQLQRCPHGESQGPRAKRREPMDENREVWSHLPYWCLERMLEQLEWAEPLGLTVAELSRKAFHGRVSPSDVWNGLMELRRNGEVFVRDLAEGPDDDLVSYWFRIGGCDGEERTGP